MVVVARVDTLPEDVVLSATKQIEQRVECSDVAGVASSDHSMELHDVQREEGEEVTCDRITN